MAVALDVDRYNELEGEGDLDPARVFPILSVALM